MSPCRVAQTGNLTVLVRLRHKHDDGRIHARFAGLGDDRKDRTGSNSSVDNKAG